MGIAWEHKMEAEYIRAMDIAGYELLAIEEFCFFRNRQTGEKIGLDFQPGIYDYLQELPLAPGVRKKVKEILPEVSWNIAEYDFEDPGYIRFVLELQEDEKIFRLKGVYRIRSPQEGPDHKLVSFHDESIKDLKAGVIGREWDKIESSLKEAAREKEILENLIKHFKSADEITSDDQDGLDRLLGNKLGIRMDFSGQTFYDVRFSGTIQYADFSGCRFHCCRFSDAVIKESDFSGAEICAELRECCIDHTSFQDASLSDIGCLRTQILNSDFYGAKIKNVYLGRETYLSGNNFNQIQAEGICFEDREQSLRNQVSTKQAEKKSTDFKQRKRHR